MARCSKLPNASANSVLWASTNAGLENFTSAPGDASFTQKYLKLSGCTPSSSNAFGSTTLPKVLDIFAPTESSTNPWQNTDLGKGNSADIKNAGQ